MHGFSAANRSLVIDTIHLSTPRLLHEPYPDSLILPNITLHMLPDSHIHLPTVTGKHPYKTTVKLMQFLVTTLLVSSSSSLVIISSRLDHSAHQSPRRHPHNHIRHHSDQLQEPVLNNETPPRLIVRWRTVSDSKPEPFSPTHINYSWSSTLTKIDPRNLGILPNEYPVLTGIFEFEFDEDCSGILVHTITDVEYLTSGRAAEATANVLPN